MPSPSPSSDRCPPANAPSFYTEHDGIWLDGEENQKSKSLKKDNKGLQFIQLIYHLFLQRPGVNSDLTERSPGCQYYGWRLMLRDSPWVSGAQRQQLAPWRFSSVASANSDSKNHMILVVTVPSTRVHSGVPACPVQQHRNSSNALAICQPRRKAIAVIKMFPGTADKGNENGAKASTGARGKGRPRQFNGSGPGFLAESCMLVQRNGQDAEEFVTPSLQHGSYNYITNLQSAFYSLSLITERIPQSSQSGPGVSYLISSSCIQRQLRTSDAESPGHGPHSWGSGCRGAGSTQKEHSSHFAARPDPDPTCRPTARPSLHPALSPLRCQTPRAVAAPAALLLPGVLGWALASRPSPSGPTMGSPRRPWFPAPGELPARVAKQPQFPQPLLIRLLLQTLHQLRCPPLDTLQHLNVSLVVGDPKLNTVFEVRPHQCRVQGHDHFPRHPDQEELDETFFRQLEEASCTQALVFTGRAKQPPGLLCFAGSVTCSSVLIAADLASVHKEPSQTTETSFPSPDYSADWSCAPAVPSAPAALLKGSPPRGQCEGQWSGLWPCSELRGEIGTRC
ncbi:hypothetical protein QYF61_022952 [Mycteria americana]|uniref:Uncharacterized protein n=1 Tax=Mycteria americana TaxID=33587 RepID=A0AAN7PL51_MYCAM|nr:hypothetical protein QYF61_022952 [Mycteria americana]